MGFVAGFYSFNLHIANAAAATYADLRLKTPRHPEESLEYLYSRVIAYAHCFRPGQEFTQGLYEPKEPAIWAREITGDVRLWAEVGIPDEDKLRKTLRRYSDAELRIYFENREQITRFCWYMRGSTSNWAAGIRFFIIDEQLTQALTASERFNSDWQLTFVDEALYLTVDGTEYEGSVRPVEIWEEYQSSLAEAQ